MKTQKETQKEQRVIIAKDVIKTLYAGTSYRASKGGFFIHPSKNRGDLFIDVTENLQSIIKEKSKTCSVCAKGALMVSTIDKFNECSVIEFKNSHEEIDEGHYLLDYFPKNMLDAIEIIFERCHYHWCESINYSNARLLIDASRETFKKHDSNNILIFIMQNIIDNNGELHFADLVYGD